MAQEVRDRLDRVAAKLGIERTVDIQDLIYQDDDRADVAAWLNDHGWRASGAELRRRDAPAGPLGRGRAVG